MLQLTALTKFYQTAERTVRAVDDVTLSVAAGEFVALRGASGCGKSTLLLAAGGLLRPDAGEVAVAGIRPYALSSEGRARFRAANVGFVFQQFHLVPYLSVLENICTAALAQPVANAADRARELAAQLGLTPRLEHVPAQLSTGERQRVALARALFHRPKLLLADEPTGNLDGDNAARVLDGLAEFAAAGGAVLLVTHDAAAAARADRTLTLDRGKLVNVPAEATA